MFKAILLSYDVIIKIQIVHNWDFSLGIIKIIYLRTEDYYFLLKLI